MDLSEVNQTHTLPPRKKRRNVFLFDDQDSSFSSPIPNVQLLTEEDAIRLLAKILVRSYIQKKNYEHK